ncbi:MAG: hypothetical protein N2049_02910 [Anaerolineales bacterium]|nr:hypothetical protein [Anaerolineales bacterium]MDW8226400.1 hypothetical protein [Anaerolineales bacterium]
MNMQWLPGFTLLILIVGGVASLGLSNIELLNPTTSQAEAERIRIDNNHQNVMYQLEEQLAAAKTDQEITRIRHEMELEETRHQAELARIAADQAYYETMLNINANIYQGFMIVLVIASGAVTISVIVIVTKLALARIPVTEPARPPAAVKQAGRQSAGRRYSPNGYEQMRINARQRELLELAIIQRRIRAAYNGKAMTPEEYKNLPLAGD